MSKILLAFFLSALTFLFLDFLWLTVIAKQFYRTHLGSFLAPEPQLWAAGVFYFIFLVGLMVFVVAPNLENHQTFRALTLGCLYGLVTYATYDLTNQATLKDWPLVITLVDLCWGSALTGAVSYIAVALTGYVSNRLSW